MLVFGHYLLGKIDHLPGYFYVSTRFGHLWFIPLVPEQALLIIDDGAPSDKLRGIKIPFQWRSAIVGWMRGFVVLGLIASIGACAAFISLALNGLERTRSESWQGLGIAVVVSVFFGICYWATIRLTRISLGRAIELGKLLGIPQHEIEARICGREIAAVAEQGAHPRPAAPPSDQIMAAPYVAPQRGDE